jgi:carbonic anhydrase/acetyltransferase-like protein (isoleucine patch superfamily)
MIYSLGNRQPHFDGDNYIAPDATLVGAVSLGRDASVWFQSVLRADNEPIVIGERSNIQDASVLHVDDGVPLHIGCGVSIGHQVMLHGCRIEDGALIGINAVVLNHAVIGAESLVGANALIPEGKQIPPRSLVLGSPGRVVRELSDEEVQGLRAIADHYVAKGREYRTELQPWPGPA